MKIQVRGPGRSNVRVCVCVRVRQTLAVPTVLCCSPIRACGWTVTVWDVKSRDYFLNLSGAWQFYGARGPFEVQA
jgi:hypothetical protein